MRNYALGQDYGFSQQTVAAILPIYPNLEKFTTMVVDFSNRDLRYLAGIKNERFRKAVWSDSGGLQNSDNCRFLREVVLDKLLRGLVHSIMVKKTSIFWNYVEGIDKFLSMTAKLCGPEIVSESKVV